MTKAVSLSLGFIFLLTAATRLPAQTSSTDVAVNRAVINQANTILLRQKLEEARGLVSRGDLAGAAKLYEDAYTLVEQIGSGIDAETTQTVSGLTSTRLELARQAQRNGDLHEADAQVSRVLKVDPHNATALAFKKQNDQIIAQMKGKMPDTATLEQIPVVANEKTDAGTLVQDGKLLYEMGKFEEAEVKLNQAIKLDPDSEAAYYYLNLAKQARYSRAEHKQTTEMQDKMVQVEQQWEPKVGVGLPVPNPYASTNLIHTGSGRENIYNKLGRIRMDSVNWADGFPLKEAIRYLIEQSKLRDPDKKGINFLFNPNADNSAAAAAAAAGGGGPGAPVRVDPNSGLPVAAPAAEASAEAVDPSTINITLTLDDVRLTDLLDAIVLVADKPIKYSVEDYGIVFSTKPSGPEPTILEMRVFKVDPNTFYQGLQSVTSFSFATANSSSGGGGGGGNNGGGGGGNNGGGGGGNNGGGGGGNNVSGAVVPVVDIAPGGGRGNNGGNGGGGGGGGRTGGGAGGTGGGAGGTGGGGIGGNGGVNYVTSLGQMQDVSLAAKTFFGAVGVDLTTPGRSIAFNDRLGLLFIRATPQELDTVERTIQALNQVAPQVHIKARFIEVEQDDNAALGFDWYLGNFVKGAVVANGGSSPSLTVPVSSSNPLGAFPGNTAASVVGPGSFNGQITDQLLTGGLRNSGPALATVTGILTDPNFRVVLHALEQRGGVQTLAEPEVVTTSGRQTQMRATDIKFIVTGFEFQQGGGGTTTTTATP